MRRKAPFWLQDGDVNVRLNKDGSFGSDAAGVALIIEGNWKVEKAQLKLVWKSDKHEKVYPIGIENRLPVVAGVPLKDGKFSIANQTE